VSDIRLFVSEWRSVTARRTERFLQGDGSSFARPPRAVQNAASRNRDEWLNVTLVNMCSVLLPTATPHALWSLRLYAFWTLRKYAVWPQHLYAFWPLRLYVERNLHIHRGNSAKVTVHMDNCTNYKHTNLRLSRSMEEPLYICANCFNVQPEENGLTRRRE
jgi:hypothetical protein